MSSMNLNVDTIISSLKELDQKDLMEVLKSAAVVMGKKINSSSSSNAKAAKAVTQEDDEEVPAAKAKKVPKANAPPKGAVPTQLAKNSEWVNFVLKDALENGWPSYIVSRKNIKAGVVNETEMPKSIMHDGAHVFNGSVTAATPCGKQLALGDAMQLSKKYWSPKEGKGERQDLYDTFLEIYEFEESAQPAAMPKKVIRKSLEEAKEERDRLRAEKAEKDAEEKAEKKAERDAAKAERERIKEEAKEEKRLEREAAKAEREAAKVVKAAKSVPVKAVKPTTIVKASTSVPIKKAAKAAVEEVKEDIYTADENVWIMPTPGAVKPWTHNGTAYFRSSKNEIFTTNANGEIDEYHGVYDEDLDMIDTSIEQEDEDE